MAEANNGAMTDVIVGTGAHKGNDKLVLSFCYPAAKSVTAVERVAKATSKDGSFDLTFRYAYRDGNNDAAEYAALRTVLGESIGRTPIVAFKSHVGHTLGGAGAVELALSLLAMREGVAPPTAGTARKSSACWRN